jgi:hypothetical protein
MGDRKHVVKRDHLGREGLAEVMASRLASCVMNLGHVEYTACLVRGDGADKPGCFSFDFCGGSEMISAHDILRLGERKAKQV